MAAQLDDLAQNLRLADSTCAANMANGVWNANQNLAAATKLRLLLGKVTDAGCHLF